MKKFRKWVSSVLSVTLMTGLVFNSLAFMDGSIAAAATSRTIASGAEFTILKNDDGSLLSWGSNQAGQLGNGTFNDSLTPVRVIGMESVSAIDAGSEYTLALLTNGTVWTWGSNANGLGNGSTMSPVPVQVIGLTGITQVSAYQQHSLALKQDGTVWAWGDNASGQLGDGTTVSRSLPVQIPALAGITDIATGDQFSMALSADGQLYTWGHGAKGQLGSGSRKSRSTPDVVSGLPPIEKIYAGNRQAFAVDVNGDVWAWGDNKFGELGDGTGDLQLSPVKITGLPDISQISVGKTHSLALSADGTVWTWGVNRNGVNGVGGNNTTYLEPVQIPTLQNIVYVEAGPTQSFAIDADGTVWVWGNNAFGQLGDGTTKNQPVPIPLVNLPNLAVTLGEVLENSVELTWTINVPVAQYTVKRDGIIVYQGTDLTFLDTGLQAETTYTYSVEAYNAAGELLDREIVTVLTPVQPVVTAIASNITPTGFDLSWSVNVPMSHYVVMRDGIVIYEGASLSLAEAGLLPDTTYTYTIEAYDSQNRLRASAVLPVSTIPAAVNVTASNVTQTTTDLSYGANYSVSKYVVKRGAVVVYEGTNTSFTDTFLIPDTDYTYTVEGWDADNRLLATGTVLVHTAPAVLTVTSSNLTPTSLDLNFSADVPVAAYTVKRDGVILYEGTNLTLADTGLFPDSDYNYTVEGYDATGQKIVSSNLTVHTPQAAATLAAVDVTQTTARLSYSANFAASKFVLKRGNVVIYEGTDLTFLDTWLLPDRDYAYTLEVYDSFNRNLATAALTVHTDPATLTANVNNLTPTTVTLGYSADVTVDKYVIKRGDTVVYEGTDLTFTDSGLSPDTDYTYTIEAWSASNTMLASKTVVAHTAAAETPDPNVILTANAYGSSSSTIDLNYSANVPVAQYAIERDGILLYQGTNTTYRDSGLAASTSYTYTVKAYDADGNLIATQTVTGSTWQQGQTQPYPNPYPYPYPYPYPGGPLPEGYCFFWVPVYVTVLVPVYPDYGSATNL